MSDGAERELFLGDAQPLGQRVQRGLRARAGAIDGRVTGVFAVTGIIDEQERVTVVWITRENGRPIKCERAIPTEGNPNAFRPLFARRYVVSRLFPRGQRVGDLDAIRGKRMRVSRVVRTRMINHR